MENVNNINNTQEAVANANQALGSVSQVLGSNINSNTQEDIANASQTLRDTSSAWKLLGSFMSGVVRGTSTTLYAAGNLAYGIESTIEIISNKLADKVLPDNDSVKEYKEGYKEGVELTDSVLVSMREYVDEATLQFLTEPLVASVKEEA